MTSAPIAQQRLLIDLQDIDSRLARLRHERKHLPVLGRIESVIERLKTNKRAAIQADAALSEAKTRVTRSEDEVGQVVRRAEVLRERLHSGNSAARDLSAIQGEIDQLGQRQSALEEAQIAAMEALDSAREESERLKQEESDIRVAGRELTAKRDAEFARLDQEIDSLEKQRADLAGTVETALLSDYEAVRASTGGLGAVALRGRTVEGGAVEISPQELARIVAAPQDQVIHAEENDVIVVRMDI
ncbi:zinc ribbon domain protein [Actinomyces johnsonii F0510]|uniref:Zinc ribbon domain protein n=1 Tax=Actinomyces johnsonii F0510 TaxID=1227262 RepID=U1PZN6_9ACTO|nr:zinc ribbon domain protein [Actinomyces johnsonii]ERH15479.1 zinc ribbon domain protein [Actinomyces johnsonii F0510]